jgi:hypothetical protein
VVDVSDRIQPGEYASSGPIPVNRDRAALLSIIVASSHTHSIMVLVSDEKSPPSDYSEWFRREYWTGLAANLNEHPVERPGWPAFQSPQRIISLGAMRWAVVLVANMDRGVSARIDMECEVVYA